jgi:hypothetical protein
MAGDQQKPPEPSNPPDKLFNKEKDDSQYVTEVLTAMKPSFHRLLAAWNIITGLAALWYAITIWPPEPPKGETGQQGNAPKTVITQDSIINQSAADTSYQASIKNQDTTKNKSASDNEESDPGILLLKLSFLFGVLGGATHGFSSLLDFRGQRRLFQSWILWYFGRPILGGMLSVIVYIILRAGLFSVDAPSSSTSFYGIAAFSTLTGMFTDAATNKLSEIFSTIFQTKTGKEREGKLIPDSSNPKGAANNNPPQQ